MILHITGMDRTQYNQDGIDLTTCITANMNQSHATSAAGMDRTIHFGGQEAGNDMEFTMCHTPGTQGICSLFLLLFVLKCVFLQMSNINKSTATLKPM